MTALQVKFNTFYDHLEVFFVNIGAICDFQKISKSDSVELKQFFRS